MKAAWAGGVLGLLGCAAPHHRAPDPGSWTERANAHAVHFAIAERGPERRLTVFGAGGRADTIAVYVLAPDGPLFLPARKLAVASTTILPFIGALERRSFVVGAAHLDRMVDDTWTMREPAVTEIGTTNGLDLEQLVMIAPDVILDHPHGQGSERGALSTPTMVITEYMEEHPLGRAEWIRFFGVLLDREEMADSLFTMISDRYRSATHMKHKAEPLVFFGSNWQHSWYAPSAGSYMARLISDAGGRYVFADRPAEGNLSLDIEAVLDLAGRVDHFGQILALDDTVDAVALAGGDERLARQPAIRHGGFVANSARADVFGQAVLEPDVVLRDLRGIFHPEEETTHRPRYFHRLAQ